MTIAPQSHGNAAIRTLVVCLVAALVSVAAPALAQEADADDQARIHFEAGSLHFDRGAYEEAQLEFEAAFELSERPALLYNLFLTSERLANYDAAISYLERYLAEGSPDEERRATLEPRLENLRERQNNRTQQELEADGGEPGDETELAAPEPAGGNMLPAYVAFAVAGAGLVTFAVAGGLALKEDSALTATCAASCNDDQVSSLRTRTLVADIGWITAIAAAAAGTVLVFTLGKSSDSSQATLGSWVAPAGGGVVAQGSF